MEKPIDTGMLTNIGLDKHQLILITIFLGMFYINQWYVMDLTCPSMYSVFTVYLLVTPVMVLLFEGCLEVKLPTVWTDEKQRWAESERREE